MKQHDASNAISNKKGRDHFIKSVLPAKRARSRYELNISPLVFVFLCLGSSVLPYLTGQWIVQHQPMLAAVIHEKRQSMLQFLVVNSQASTSHRQESSLPKIPLKPGACLVKSKFTSKVVFEPSGSVHYWDNHDKAALEQIGSCGAYDISIDEEMVKDAKDTASGLHEPMGQHLMVDFEHVDVEFLASEERLATAMIQLVEKSSLTMLSYHCHSYERFGVSCVGILLESHVSLHSYPAFGILALDLFTCGRNNPLLPLLGYIEHLFGLPATSKDSDPPHMVWSHKRRGFGLNETEERNPEAYEYDQVLGFTGYQKIQVVELETGFQAVKIMDLLHEETLDRSLFLDGVLQSRKHGEAAYHEALVHSAMFVHPEPERVAIIGGGEGATLREVLKHRTVEEVVMIEIDERLVEIAKEHLQEWNDCSSIVGSPKSCFDDPRATLVFTDAVAWFTNHFGNKTSSSMKPFDVIIMDALDPNSMVWFSDLLYGNADLNEAFSRALGDHGVFVAQMGEAFDLCDAAPHQTTNDQYHRFVEGLAGAGFNSIFEYAESHGRFMAPWDFVIALKDSNTRARWFRNEAQLQLDMLKRSLLTETIELPFRFFDGATFMSYQFPNRIVEETWCRSNKEECGDGHGFDPSLPDRNELSYKVAKSSVANGGRGVFSKEKIAKDSYLGIEPCVNGIFVPPNTFEIMEDFSIETSYPTSFWAAVFEGYILGYGNDSAGIEASLLTFSNHGCNKTYNIGQITNVSELTVDLDTLANQTFYNDKNYPYHPFIERHFPSWGCPSFKALRDIEEGEEILDNYLVLGGSDGSKLYDFVAELRSMCSGGIGAITQYELEREQQVLKEEKSKIEKTSY